MGKGKNRWTDGEGWLDNGSAAATGELLQQDFHYGTTAGAELEMLEGRGDLWG